jgi:hypothetical protein
MQASKPLNIFTNAFELAVCLNITRPRFPEASRTHRVPRLLAATPSQVRIPTTAPAPLACKARQANRPYAYFEHDSAHTLQLYWSE